MGKNCLIYNKYGLVFLFLIILVFSHECRNCAFLNWNQRLFTYQKEKII
jgi:hypothetical protein